MTVLYKDNNNPGIDPSLGLFVHDCLCCQLSLLSEISLNILLMSVWVLQRADTAACESVSLEHRWYMTCIRPQGYKKFVMLNSAEHEHFLLINVKMPTIVGILTFMSRKK